MGYLVLARKWRPQRFDEVVGQESVTRTLKQALESDRVAHSFLFTGSRGIGKTTLARIMAKALACEKPGEAEPCNECSNCVEISAGRALDVVEIDGASNTGVDDVRELREVARFAPTRCRYKIFIIDEVHMLSTGAFNALLKILEERPPHVKFIFATTEVHKIPVTILSRCQRYDFKRIHTARIITRLEEVLAKENTSISPEGLSLIAHAADGGMRDALSLADQVLSFAPENASGEDVARALGLIDRRAIVSATRALFDRDARGALDIVKNAHENGHDLKQLVSGLAQECRHLAIASSVGSIEGHADLSPDALQAIDEMAQSVNARDVQRVLQALLTGIERVTRSEQARLEVELLVLQICDRPPAQNALNIAHALVRLDALAKGKEVPPLPEGAFTQMAKASLNAPLTKVQTPQAASTNQVEITKDSPKVEEPHQAPATSSAPKEQANNNQRAQKQMPESKEQVSHGAKAQKNGPSKSSASTQKSAQPVSKPDAKTSQEEEEEEEDVASFHFDPALGYDLAGVDDRWLAFVREVAFKNSHIAGWLAHGHFAGTEDDEQGTVVWVAFKTEMQVEISERRKDHAAVRVALKHFGDKVRLEVAEYEEESGAEPSIAEAQKNAQKQAIADLEEHARAHPVVQKALALFGGEVREVRSSHG